MKSKNHRAGALGIAAIGLLTGCTAGSDSDFRSIFSLSGSSNLEVMQPYEGGKAHLNAGRLGNALAAFQLALAQNPADVQALNGLATTYDRLGRHELAEKHYQRALKLNPTNPQTLNNFGYSNLLQGRIDVATALLADAYAAGPTEETIGTNLKIAKAAAAVRQAERRENALPDVLASWRESANASSKTHVERTTVREQRLIIEEAQAEVQADAPQTQPPSAYSLDVAAPAIAAGRRPEEEQQPVVSAAMPPVLRVTARDERRPMSAQPDVAPNASANRTLIPTRPQHTEAKITLAALPALPARAEELANSNLILPSPNPVLVLSNGTGREAMARRIGDYLQSTGIQVTGLNNARSYAHKRSMIFYKSGWRFYADDLAKLLPGSFDVIADDQMVGDINVRLGGDLLPFDKSLYYTDVWSAPGVDNYPKIVVSNAAGHHNMAAYIRSFLETRGVELKPAKTAKRSEGARTVIYHGKRWSTHALRLSRLLPADVMLRLTDSAEVEIEVDLGDDLLDFGQTLMITSERTYAWSI